MAKSVANSVLDAALDKIATATNMTVCSAEPTNKTEADTTFKLADVAPTFDAREDGDTDGRKVRSQQKTGVAIDSTGTANHIALTDATELLYVTTCNAQALTAGGTVTIPVWDVEIADPT